jgi:hypothetical protein
LPKLTIPQPEEIPDFRANFDRDALVAYEREKQRAERHAAREARKAAAGGFGGFASGAPAEGDDGEDEGAAVAATRAAAAAVASTRAAEARTRASERLSTLEEQERVVQRARLLYEHDALRNQIAKTTQAFDAALGDLRRERFRLEGGMIMMAQRRKAWWSDVCV